MLKHVESSKESQSCSRTSYCKTRRQQCESPCLQPSKHLHGALRIFNGSISIRSAFPLPSFPGRIPRAAPRRCLHLHREPTLHCMAASLLRINHHLAMQWHPSHAAITFLRLKQTVMHTCVVLGAHGGSQTTSCRWLNSSYSHKNQ